MWGHFSRVDTAEKLGQEKIYIVIEKKVFVS